MSSKNVYESNFLGKLFELNLSNFGSTQLDGPPCNIPDIVINSSIDLDFHHKYQIKNKPCLDPKPILKHSICYEQMQYNFIREICFKRAYRESLNSDIRENPFHSYYSNVDQLVKQCYQWLWQKIENLSVRSPPTRLCYLCALVVQSHTSSKD